MPRPKKRARSYPKNKQPIDAADDDDEADDDHHNDDDDEVAAPARKSRRTKTDPTATNGVKAESSPSRSRSRRGKKNEEDGMKVKIEDDEDEVMDADDGDEIEEEAEEEFEEEEEEIFECPMCKKRFTSKYGRKYHVGEFYLWVVDVIVTFIFHTHIEYSYRILTFILFHFFTSIR